MLTSGNDPLVADAIAHLQTGVQRQDSTREQLFDVLAMARAAGCYDAVDLIERGCGVPNNFLPTLQPR